MATPCASAQREYRLRPPGEFEISEALAVGEQRGLIAQPAAQFVDDRGQHALALAGDGRRQLDARSQARETDAPGLAAV